MRLNEVLHSCSHGHVAEAAIVSIGGPFATRVMSSAAAEGESVGEFTARQVRSFSRIASERDWRTVSAQMHGSDLALLAGLEAVMTRMMNERGASDAGVRHNRSA